MSHRSAFSLSVTLISLLLSRKRAGMRAMIANHLSLSLSPCPRGTLHTPRSLSLSRADRLSIESQSDSRVDVSVRELREGNAAGDTCEMVWRGFEMATSVWREGKVWPSLSSSTHCDMELLLMWSVESEGWVKEGSKVTLV